MDNGHEVVSELLRRRTILLVFTVDHDRDSELLEEPVEVFPGNPAEPVLMGNHNFFETSFECSVQKPIENFPFEVDTAGGFFEDFVIWVFLRKVFGLSLEITFLFWG